MENLVKCSIRKSESEIAVLHDISPELLEQISGGCDGTITGSHDMKTGAVIYSIDHAQ